MIYAHVWGFIDHLQNFLSIRYIDNREIINAYSHPRALEPK